MLEILELLIGLLLKDAVAPVATKVIEDSVSGALVRPPDTVTEGFVDAGVVAQVRAAMADPTGVEPP